MATPQLSLPIAPRVLLQRVIVPALKLLPPAMDSPQARVQLVANAGQESGLETRWQVIDLKRPERKGPARGLWQFEKGTRASRGGVWGVYLHESSRYWLAQVCATRGVQFHPDAIYRAIEVDDILACCVARLLLFTDPKRLPAIGDERAAWALYKRTWRPGKPHPGRWPGNYRRAIEAVAA